MSKYQTRKIISELPTEVEAVQCEVQAADSHASTYGGEALQL